LCIHQQDTNTLRLTSRARFCNDVQHLFGLETSSRTLCVDTGGAVRAVWHVYWWFCQSMSVHLRSSSIAIRAEKIDIALTFAV
jgi:hypothetical protein